MLNNYQRIESKRAKLEIEKFILDQQLATMAEELEVLDVLNGGKQCKRCIAKEASCVPSTYGYGCQKCYDINVFCKYVSESEEGSSNRGQR